MSTDHILHAAHTWLQHGHSIIPITGDGTKRPATAWKTYQTRHPSAAELDQWHTNGQLAGIAVICGAISGNLEMLEFEARATHLYQQWLNTVETHDPELAETIAHAYTETTPTGGIHHYYRVTGPDADIGPNTRLAAQPNPDTGIPDVLIETRGTGGYSITAPTPGTCHPNGKPWTTIHPDPGDIPTITAAQRDLLHAAAHTLDATPPPPPAPEPPAAPADNNGAGGGGRPGDDYNTRATWHDILEPAGWVHVNTIGGTDHWRRPGKTHGISAVTGGPAGDKLWNFSTSSDLPTEQALSKFAAYTHYEHGGNYHTAAKALAEAGYGTRDTTRKALQPINADTTGPTPTTGEPAQPHPDVHHLNDLHRIYHRWFGEHYDTDVIDAALAAAAAQRLDGEPVWLLIVGGSGSTKTETAQSLSGAGATATSSISSEAALLSATAARDKARDATGGLLRAIGEAGLLVIKDVTTILSMPREARGNVLAALREIYDGNWARSVGSDGGKTIRWSGRITTIGAVTSAWDKAHTVISAMGDRFVLVRTDTEHWRHETGMQAAANVGQEPAMRDELARAVAAILTPAHLNPSPPPLTHDERERIIAAANVVTLARTAVEYDYRGDVIDAHNPEAPTRLAKQLTQLMRGAMAIGIDRAAALRLAIRCARDCMPPLRLAILDDVARHPHHSSTTEVRKRLEKPRSTVDRQLQTLHMLGLLSVVEVATFRGVRWEYYVADGIDPAALNPETVYPDANATENAWEQMLQ